ncbi:phosphoribosylamine--glycine ligase [Candidatus Roizmanbacteria bacterium]|nr:phosphoribosylamine--glycine ligase [Candidatus Roizmanbacteria bacterium]
MKETVAIIGGGGRESALVHAYAKSPHVNKIIAIPGNDFMQQTTDKIVQTFPTISTTDIPSIMQICDENHAGLVDIAQDAAVEAGVSNVLQRKGISVIGPTKQAGQLEWDKAWSRNFMQNNAISHPSFQICQTPKQGYEYLAQQPEQGWVIKANGLAEGKGVIITENSAQALRAIEEMKRFGKAGEQFLIEQLLVGEEFSTYAISDGNSWKLIGSAQDHKRVNNFDIGLNTGGMGCSTPPLILTPELIKQVQTQIIAKTFEGMQKIGRPYTGILYLGGMVIHQQTTDQPFVIEFNARWGDPEAQIIVPSLINDFFELGLAVAKGELHTIKLSTDQKSRVVVAGTSRGYPEDYSQVRGKEIFGLKEAQQMEGVTVYGAGVKRSEDRYYADGGRLFYIVGEGITVIEAREKAYEAMSLISIEGNNLHYRTDIGWRDVERLRHK